MTSLDPNFAIGSENTQFWGPMGTAIISGLTFSTFLTLVIVPVMYSTFDSIALRLRSESAEVADRVREAVPVTGGPITIPALGDGGNGTTAAAVTPDGARG